jgi:hypothetical protein
LLGSLVLFIGMTAISAASFYSLLKIHAVRYWLQFGMWTSLLMIGWYYWT